MNKPAPSPSKGQIWEVIDGCDVEIQYLFTAPIIFNGAGRLNAGEQVMVVTETTDTPPVVVSFLPVRYDDLHDRLVPLDIRNTPRYKKYLLSVKTEYFCEHFKFIGYVA